MRYVLLIYENEAAVEALTQADLQARVKEFGDVTVDLFRSGKLKGGEGLGPTSAATSVRVRDGKTLTADGPFAETPEQLTGFYVVEAEGLDEATEIAARFPSARSGCVEVRPVMVIPDDSPARSEPGLLSESHRSEA